MAEYYSLAQNCRLSLNIRIISTSSSTSDEGARPILLDIVTPADCSNFPQFHNSGMFYPLGYLSFDSRPQILMMRQIKTWQGAGQLSKVQICNIPQLPFRGVIIASLFFWQLLCQVLTYIARKCWKIKITYFLLKSWSGYNGLVSGQWSLSVVSFANSGLFHSFSQSVVQFISGLLAFVRHKSN